MFVDVDGGAPTCKELGGGIKKREELRASDYRRELHTGEGDDLITLELSKAIILM